MGWCQPFDFCDIQLGGWHSTTYLWACHQVLHCVYMYQRRCKPTKLLSQKPGPWFWNKERNGEGKRRKSWSWSVDDHNLLFIIQLQLIVHKLTKGFWEWVMDLGMFHGFKSAWVTQILKFFCSESVNFKLRRIHKYDMISMIKMFCHHQTEPEERSEFSDFIRQHRTMMILASHTNCAQLPVPWHKSCCVGCSVV